MISPTSNSLLYKTLLSPQINIDASQAGQQHLAILTHRVKKLDQCERKELSCDLDKILYELKKPTLHNAVPLVEKGVCVLLLTDCGTHTQSHNLVDSFFRFLRNTFGDRISSGSVIDKIVEIKTLAKTKPVTQLNYDTMKEALAHEKGAKTNAYQARVDQSARMRKLHDLKASCFELNKFLSGRLGRKIDGVALARLTIEVNNLIATAKLNGLTEEFKLLVGALERTVPYIKQMEDLTSFFTNLLAQDSRYLTEDEKGLVENLKERSQKPSADKIALKDAAAKLLYSSALDKSKCLFKVLDSEYKKEGAVLSEIESGIGLIDKRSNFLAICERSLIIDAKIQGARDNLEKHTREMRLCAKLYQTAKSLNSEINQLNGNSKRVAFLETYIESRLNKTSPYKKEFTEHIMFLYGVLSGNWDKYGQRYPINVQKYLPVIGTDSAEKQALYSRLRTGLGVHFAILDEAGKKAYAEYFLEYLQIVLVAEHKLCASRCDRCNDVIQNAQHEKAEALAQAQAFVQPPIPIASQPLIENPPLTEQARLVNLANELVNVPNSLSGVATRLDAEFSAYKEAIHHNFYFVMLKEDKIKKGHHNWGGEVFQGNNLDSLLKDDVTSEQLNAYRARAITLAAEGKVSGADDPNL